MDLTSNPTKLVVSDGGNKNYIIIILSVLLILSLLGVNLFYVMGNIVQVAGNIVQVIVNLFKPLFYQILAMLGYTTGTLLNKTADITSDVARGGIDIAEGTVQSVGNLLKKASVGVVNNETKNELDTILSEPKSDISESSIQKPISSSKATWCLVGEQNGRRGCVNIDDASKCMSGKVFPTAEMCLNPTFSPNIPPKNNLPPHPLKSIKSNPDRSTW